MQPPLGGGSFYSLAGTVHGQSAFSFFAAEVISELLTGYQQYRCQLYPGRVCDPAETDVCIDDELCHQSVP